MGNLNTIFVSANSPMLLKIILSWLRVVLTAFSHDPFESRLFRARTGHVRLHGIKCSYASQAEIGRDSGKKERKKEEGRRRSRVIIFFSKQKMHFSQLDFFSLCTSVCPNWLFRLTWLGEEMGGMISVAQCSSRFEIQSTCVCVNI